MVIGILQFELFIRGGESLKDKRRVVQSVKDRLHREHLVSIAEVAAHDTLNRAVLALACVGGDGARVGEVLDHVTTKLRTFPGAELGDCDRQLIRGTDIKEPPAGGLDDSGLANELLARFQQPGPDAEGSAP
jgi:uncharacterized protein